MYDKTMTFSVYEDKEKEMKTILTVVGTAKDSIFKAVIGLL